MLDLEKITVRKLKMKLKSPFSTSFGSMQEKVFFLIEIQDKEGVLGYGESTAFLQPWYTEETVGTTEHLMKEFLIPLLFAGPLTHPDEVFDRFKVIRRNHMAKAALEGAVWDLYAKKQGISLAKVLGGERTVIDVGISIGLQDTTDQLLSRIEESVRQGYRRIKIKIKPGLEQTLIKTVRSRFPTLPLMVDANSAYTLNDLELLKGLDPYDLLMIEQPLGHDDILDHALLQKELKTPICLDESIHSYQDARLAIETGAAKIINIKMGRVGGLSEARRIHNLCMDKGIPVWCGGMLEAGVGRAQNIALTTLPGFTLPGDTAASANYWEEDLINPEVIVQNGQIKVSERPGIGYDINWEAVTKYLVEEWSITKGTV